MSRDTEPKNRSLILPTLIVSISSIDPPALIVSICLIEVALAFGVSVSLAGQIRSIGSILAIIAALAMGVMSVRYDYKTLLLGGLIINLVSALCCTFAPSFTLLVICFAAMGLVTSLVTPMVFSYIGEFYPDERRSQVVGTLASLRSVSYLVMVQLIGLVVGNWSWREAFLFLVAPMTFLGIILSLKVLPRVSSSETVSEMNILEGYRGVLASRSALACLLGNLMAGGAWVGGVVVYNVTFLREAFLLSLSDASNIVSGMVVGVLVGNYLGGLLAKKLGNKRVIVASSFLTGVLIICYMNAPNIQLTVVISVVTSLAAGIILTCANTLLLGQVPRYRGTVMSVNSAATQLGVALGAALGGLILYLYSWGMMGVTFGAMHVLASCVYKLGARESGLSTQPGSGQPGVIPKVKDL
jgi:predicted MFS family arabinose efflux permease